jgi:hypothetical protein
MLGNVTISELGRKIRRSLHQLNILLVRMKGRGSYVWIVR